jgi:heme-degrading monooxygenase HmoA
MGTEGTVTGRGTGSRELENIMWVRVGSFLIKPGQATSLRATYNERAVPKVRAQPGNLACLLLEPTFDGEPFLVMTVWKDRSAAETYESSGAAAEVVSLVREFFAAPPTLRSYESSSSAGFPSPESVT